MAYKYYDEGSDTPSQAEYKRTVGGSSWAHSSALTILARLDETISRYSARMISQEHRIVQLVSEAEQSRKRLEEIGGRLGVAMQKLEADRAELDRLRRQYEEARS